MRTKRALALCALALLGCDMGALGDSPVISGQIHGWDGGTAQIKVSAGDATATGAVDTGGHFTVQLPGSADLEGSLTPQFPLAVCDQGFSSGSLPQPSPSSAQSAVASFTVNGAPLTLGAGPNQTSNGTYFLSTSYVFVNQNATVSGGYTCNDQSTVPDAPATINVRVSSGWNTLVVATNTSGSSDYGFYETNGPVPAAAQWSLSDAGMPLCIASGASCSTSTPDQCCQPPGGTAVCELSHFRPDVLCCVKSGPCTSDYDCCSFTCGDSGSCD